MRRLVRVRDCVVSSVSRHATLLPCVTRHRTAARETRNCGIILVDERTSSRGIGEFFCHFLWVAKLLLRAAACKNRELHFSDHLVEFLIFRLKIPLDL